MDMLERLAEELHSRGVPLRRDLHLAPRSFIKAGGVCSLLVEPVDQLQAAQVVALLAEVGLRWKAIGNLSNLLFPDGPIRTALISLRRLKAHGPLGEGTYGAEAGASLPALARRLSGRGFTGFSGLEGIPGSLGGAVCMNAGSYGHCIGDRLLRVGAVDPRGRIVTFEAEELGLAWRHSRLRSDLSGHLLLSAELRLVPGDPADIDRSLRASRDHRRAYQERDLPNLGSLFSTRDIYGDIARLHPAYRLAYLAVQAATRLLPADRRDRFWTRTMGALTRRYFKLSGAGRAGFSSKTFNCLVNRGGAGADELIALARRAHAALGGAIPLEIEIFEEH